MPPTSDQQSMHTKRLTPCLLLPVLLLDLLVGAPALPAQGVPSGGSIVSLIAHPTGLGVEGLWLVQPDGTPQPITGLGTAGSTGTAVNAVQLDPIDDRIWLGGINSNGNTEGQLNWVRLSATGTVAQFQRHAIVNIGWPVAAITFDDNGNPVFVSGRTATNGGIFRADRASGAVTRLAGVPNGVHNALTRDPAGNLYVGMYDLALGAGGGEVYRLAKNPDCTYQPPVLVGALPDSRISGIEWARDPLGGSQDVLVLTTFGAMYEVPAAGGTPTTLTRIGQLNWVELDERLDRFLVVDDGSYGSEVYTLSRDYVTATLHARLLNAVAGITSGVDINDAPFGDIRVVPACPPRDVASDLELGVACPPGQVAVLHVMAPVAVPVLVAAAPTHGRVSIKIPGLVVPATLAPGALVLQAACFDPTTGAVTIGAPVSWPAY